MSLLLVGTGCVSSRYAKKGAKFEEANLFEQASEAYLISLGADRGNVDATIGLKRAGQRAVDEKAVKVIKANESDDIKEAVYKYLEIKNLVSKSSAFGINFTVSEMATSSFEEAKPRYIEQIYGQAHAHLEAENFQQAQVLLTEIKTIDPNYGGDVDDMLKTSKCEPMYRKAKAAYDQKMYRTAYTLFEALVKSSEGYKDAADIMKDALSKAQIVIKVDEFKSQQGTADFASNMRSSIILAINAKKNEFIKVVSASTQRLVGEQRQALAYGADMQVGNILIPKAILSGTVTECTEKAGKLIKTTKRGYLRREVKEKESIDGEVKIKVYYDKITYDLYEMNNSAVVGFKYQLVSIETGEVLIADVVRSEQTDKLVYVEFNGESANLVPGYWEYPDRNSAKDAVSENQSEINELRGLCKKKREITPASKLLLDASEAVVGNVANKINKYNPEGK